MNLYHYTQKDDTQYQTNPKMFGENNYTQNDVNASGIPRTFFYTNPKDKEYNFKGYNLYKTSVDDSKVYDLSTDPEKLISQPVDIDKLLKKIKSKGYIGVKYNVGFPIVAVFVPLTVSKVG